MNPHSMAMPRMPLVADFAEVPNMGVPLLPCIISSATTRAKAIYCCFTSRRKVVDGNVSNAGRDLADCLILHSGRMNILTIGPTPAQYLESRRMPTPSSIPHRPPEKAPDLPHRFIRSPAL